MSAAASPPVPSASLSLPPSTAMASMVGVFGPKTLRQASVSATTRIGAPLSVASASVISRVFFSASPSAGRKPVPASAPLSLTEPTV